jgi:hypothetical protein
MPDDTPPVQTPTPPAPPQAPPPNPAPHVDHEREKAGLRAEAAANRVEARQNADRAAAAEEAARVAREQGAANVTAERTAAQERIAKANKRLITAEVKAAALSAGLQDLDLLPLCDMASVTADDEGNVAGAAEAVARWKAAKPSFFQPGAAPAPRPTGDPAPNPNPNPTEKGAMEMTQEEWRQKQAEVKRKLRAL